MKIYMAVIPSGFFEAEADSIGLTDGEAMAINMGWNIRQDRYEEIMTNIKICADHLMTCECAGNC